MESKKINTQISNALYACMDSADTLRLRELLHENYLDHDAQEPSRSYDEFVGLIEALHGGFSDIHHEVEIVHSIGPDLVFARWRMTARHTGEFFGAPATGRSVVLRGHDLMRVVDGRITELWHVEQLLQLMGQIQ